LARARIPSVYATWDVRTAETRKVEEEERAILETDVAGGEDSADPYAAQAGNLYSACMNVGGVQARGVAPLEAELAPLAGIHDVASLEKVLAGFHQQGFGFLFAFGPEVDEDDATRMIAAFDEGGLGLPDESYYLDGSADSQAVLASYQQYAASLLTLSGLSPADAQAGAAAALGLEMRLAKITVSKDDRRDPLAIWHRMSLADLQALAPLFPWSDFLVDSGVSLDAVAGGLDVKAPTFFAGLNTLLAETPPSTWQMYLRLRVVAATALALPRAFTEQKLELNHALSGVRAAHRRWEHCVAVVDAGLGMALARSYVANDLSPASRTLATDTIQRLETQMGLDLDSLGWMDDATRAEALTKLAHIQNQVGYPGAWRAYDGLSLDRGRFYEDEIAVAAFEEKRVVAMIGQPVDRDEWLMTPPTVNAYYEPDLNQMVVLAGILRPPYLLDGAQGGGAGASEGDADDMAGIGMILGHELTHGFDDKGSHYDAGGDLRNWWTPASAEQFSQRSACLISQYASYEIAGVHLDGALTLGENIADNGGIKLAWAAFEAGRAAAGGSATTSSSAPALGTSSAPAMGTSSVSTIAMSSAAASAPASSPGTGPFTPEQEFFLAFAQTWCQAQYDEMTRMNVRVNSHSPARFRVDGSLANLPGFQQAFSCKDGAPMAPVQRCQIW
jgi:predicted metalloendopeptidase